MVDKNVTVTSQAGIHARPVALLASRVRNYQGTAEIIWGDRKANINNMLELLGIAVPAGAEITVRVNGPEEEHLARELVTLIETME